MTLVVVFAFGPGRHLVADAAKSLDRFRHSQEADPFCIASGILRQRLERKTQLFMFPVDIDDFDHHIFIDLHKIVDIAHEAIGDLGNMDQPGDAVIKFDESTIRLDAGDLSIYSHSDFVIFDRTHTRYIIACYNKQVC